jgi:anaerobic selenocysteine-containing dehydrogenase
MASSKVNSTKTICPFCSLQDWLKLQWSSSTARFTKDSFISVDYDAQSPINEGSLCPRGNAVAELVDHPKRLICPRLNGQDVDWEEAFSHAATSLKDLARKHGPEAVGILAGGGLTLGEALNLEKLAREVLKTPYVAPLFPDDGAVFHSLARLGWDTGFSLKDLQERQVMLLVGDVFTEHPVISKRILRAKYKDRGHRLFVIDSLATPTTWFAHEHLQPIPGTEVLVLAGITQMLSASAKENTGEFPLKLDLGAIAKRTGVSQEQMDTVASALSSASDGAIIQSNLYGHQDLPGACAILGHALARLAGSKFSFLHLPVFCNSRGVFQVLSSAEKGQKLVSGPQILEMVTEGKIKGLLLFGLDPLSAVPSEKLAEVLGRLEFLLVADVLPTHSTPLADVLLPVAVGPEKSGQLLYLNGEKQDFELAIPAPGLAWPEKDIIENLARKLSPKHDLSATPQEIEERLKGGAKTPWLEMLAEVEPVLGKKLSADEGKETAYPLFLVPTAVPAHLGDGSLSRHLSWAKKTCGSPCIWANAALMEKLSLIEGARVQISSKADRAIFPLLLDRKLPENVIAAPAHFPQVRRLFSWKIDSQYGDLQLGPERVLLSLPKESG